MKNCFSADCQAALNELSLAADTITIAGAINGSPEKRMRYIQIIKEQPGASDDAAVAPAGDDLYGNSVIFRETTV